MRRWTGRGRLWGLVLAVALLAWGLPVGALAGQGEERAEWLIGFDGPPDRGQLERVERSGGEVVRELSGLPVVLVELPERAVEQIAGGEGVRYVEPNGQMWAMDTSLPWGVERIDAEGAWETGETAGAWESESGEDAGEGVTVAVLDSGITHEYAFEDPPVHCTDIAEDGDCEDVFGHGTHVAGTIAASHETLTPGIAPNVALHDVKVLGDDGSGTHAEIAEGIAVAADGDGDVGPADVINMSLGGGSNSAVEDAVKSAEESGVLLVAAAGNGGNPGGNNDSVSYPANYEQVVAVAATDQDDERATFSSTGPGVEIAAPGVDIPSTWPEEGDHDFDCDEDCDYHDGSGTSMASPHVAGAAALAFAVDQGHSHEDVREALTASAEPLNAPEHQVGAGLVDATELLDQVLDDEESEEPETGAIAGTVTDDADDPTAIEGAEVSVEEVDEATATTDEDGVYEIADLPEGEHTVTAAADGYESATQSLEVDENGEATANFELTAEEEPEAGTVTVDEVAYETRGGRDDDRHLEITITVVDNGEPVADVDVDAILDRVDGTETESWSFSGTTDSDGTVTFTRNNHDDGCYTTTVEEVDTDGWDEDTPDNEYGDCEES